MRRRLQLGAAVLVLVLVAGVVVGVSAGGSTPAASTQLTTATVPTSTALPAGSQTLTQPQLKLGTPTTPADTTELPGYGRPTISIGDMNTPQQFLLGALYSAALQQQGFSVSVTRNIGTPEIYERALQQGTLDLIPEYLDSLDPVSSWDADVAGLGTHFRTRRRAYELGQAYARKHGYELLSASPGNDSGGLAVMTQFAQENHVTSLADLGRLPLLAYGLPIGNLGFWRAEQAYGFNLGTRVNVLTGSEYAALSAGAVQVAYVNSTDPQLSNPKFTLLADPRHVFGFGNVISVTTLKVISAEGPAFAQTIDRVNSLLTTRALQGLNTEMQTHTQSTVASQFLQGNGIVPPPFYSAG